ncbi:S8 family serine peptidase [Jiangella asiatica]|nr:S8 family serine peptidase [Jiangella asiatica]
MHRPAESTRRRRSGRLAAAMVAATSVTATGVAVLVPSGSAAAPDDETTSTYIVQMTLDPVATYDGDVDDLAATRVGPDETIDPEAPEVLEYTDHLQEQHRDALADVDGGEPLYDYVYAFDGFAAELTEAQAADLAARPDVVAVTEDEKVEVDTSSTPSFLGLDEPGGLWEQLGGAAGSLREPGAGEDIVIGVIDSGIWPESRSFSDRDERGRRTYAGRPFGFRGDCDAAAAAVDDSWKASLCTPKLIAAQHFNAGWGGDEAIAEQLPWEFLSPRDYNGHGTHTASTAGGNHGVAATGAAAAFGTISGIAPRASIAAYKALWSTEDASTAQGYPSDLVAAVDQAVADGVDVINYSVSGTTGNLLDPVEIAFMNAADAGIFVAASAGNSGPAAGTVAHPSPWITTVAAGTHDRDPVGSATLGDGSRYSGASLAATAAGPAPLVDSATVGLPDADPTLVAQCYAAVDNGGVPVLDPASVAGKIVLCDRGVTPRVNKSRAVAEAGGIGMILVNTDENSLNADFHSVPTVHLAETDRAALKAYAATEGATATVNVATVGDDAPAPYTAAFSSRGPTQAGGGNLLKPDLMAPGQDILAAVAPPGFNGAGFGLASGTSMSAPHVAGLAALLADQHPDWSPMMIKSALMTTGSDVLDGDATDPAVIFSQGAGHVQPTGAADPGLVYDNDVNDWLAFLCGTTQGVEEAACDALVEDGHSLDPSDLNTPSIAVDRVSRSQTVTREVTNVGDTAATYTASTTGLDGIDVTVSPSTLTLAPGETASFTVTFEYAGASVNATLGGYLTWTDGSHDVRSPIVLRAGDEDWEARYDGPSNFFGFAADSGQETLLSPDGDRLFVAGNSQPPIPGTLRPDYVTAAYDPVTGEQLWAVRYDGPAQGSDELAAMALSPDGATVYVTGSSAGVETGWDFTTIAYDAATGEQLWLARHDGPGSETDSAADLVVSPDGATVYITGSSNMAPQESDFAVVAYDAATGAELWVSHYNDPVDGTDDPRAMAIGPDGSTIVVTGQSRSADGGLTDIGTVAFAADTGERLWEVLHDGSAHGIDVPNAVMVTADGAAIVAGSTRDTETKTDWAVLAYSMESGEQLWSTGYDGAGGTDVPRAGALSPDGSTVVVTGNAQGTDDGDYATVAFDVATGERLWAAGHGGSAGALDIASDLAFTADGGQVVVTGQSNETGTSNDYVTIAYDAGTGEDVWTGRYDGFVSGDSGQAVAVDSTPEAGHRVFVTGHSSIPLGLATSNADMTTVAYFARWE